LRVLFWNEAYLPILGGVERMTRNLAAGLLARGHQVAVVAEASRPDLPAHEVIDGVEVHRFPFFQVLNARDTETLTRFRAIEQSVLRLKADFRADIVHVNLAGANPLFHLRTGGEHGPPTVVMLQAPISTQAAASPVVRQLTECAWRLVAPSQAAAIHFAEALGGSVEVRAIFPGVASLGVVRSPEFLEEYPRRIVALGRLVHDKGFDTAIRAMTLLRRQAKLVIVGDGPARPELEDLVAALDLGDMVAFAGRLDDHELGLTLSGAYAAVVPSRHLELFGMVAAEFALCGLPVIASNVGGLPEVVADGATGYVVPPDDPAALASSLVRLCANPALARQMGEAARNRALAKFTSHQLVDQFEDLYRAVIEEWSARTDA
jgi:glycogen(starch) synthase